MKLYKTIAVIWTDYDPAELQLSDLAREAETGDAYCSCQTTVVVENAEDDEQAPDMEFFATEDTLAEVVR